MTTTLITTEDDLQTAFAIRKAVFIEEQQIPASEEYDEFDALDAACEHILVSVNAQPVGTGRLRVVDGYGKLERICILEEYRKYGLGKVIIQTLEKLVQEKGLTKSKLSAQVYAEGFYEKLGYTRTGEEYMDAGIPHILMKKQFNKA